MPFLLMVFLTVVCLPAWRDPPGFVKSAEWSAALTWLGMALVVLESFWSAHRVRRALGRAPGRRDRIAARYDRLRLWRQLLLVGVFALAVYGFGWAWAAGQLWSADGGKTPLPGVKILTLAPFFAALLLSWVFAYDADRALYVASARLLDGDALTQAFLDGGPAAASALDPAKEFGGRWSYVAFQGRQKLALVFLPVLLLVLQQEISLRIPEDVQNQWPWTMGALAVTGVLAVLLALPWMVRLALGLKPLPPGPIRDRLLAAARRLRFRCSDLLVWNTRGGMANAMVIGVMPWPRYVVFTDRFLEEFTGDEAEAVFGHEVGHIKHQHMPFYLAFLLLSIAALGYGFFAVVYPLLPGAAETGAAPSMAAILYGLPLNDAWMPAGAAALLAYIFVVFGFLSRRCERQADVYGCRVASCGRPDCVGHDDGVGPAAWAPGLCPTGVRTFIYALEKVARVNGINRDRPGFFQSWQHGTIGRRVAFLGGLLEDPAAEPRFQRRVAVMNWGLIAVLGMVLGVLAAFSPPAVGDSGVTPQGAPAAQAPGDGLRGLSKK